jgi:hypothetical protein
LHDIYNEIFLEKYICYGILNIIYTHDITEFYNANINKFLIFFETIKLDIIYEFIHKLIYKIKHFINTGFF